MLTRLHLPWRRSQPLRRRNAARWRHHDDQGENLRLQDRGGARRGARRRRRLRRLRLLRRRARATSTRAIARGARRRGARPRAGSSRCSSIPTTRARRRSSSTVDARPASSCTAPRRPSASPRSARRFGLPVMKAITVASGRRRRGGLSPIGDVPTSCCSTPRRPDRPARSPAATASPSTGSCSTRVRGRLDFMLSGGLTPDNVAEAIRLDRRRRPSTFPPASRAAPGVEGRRPDPPLPSRPQRPA